MAELPEFLLKAEDYLAKDVETLRTALRNRMEAQQQLNCFSGRMSLAELRKREAEANQVVWGFVKTARRYFAGTAEYEKSDSPKLTSLDAEHYALKLHWKVDNEVREEFGLSPVDRSSRGFGVWG